MAMLTDLQKMVAGMFTPASSTRNPQNVSGSIYDLARQQEQARAMQRLGGGLIAAAVPQTPLMRAQALQGAFSNMGGSSTDTYNTAQMLLAEQKARQQADREAKFSARLNEELGIGDGVAGAVSLPSAPPDVSTFGPRVQAPMPQAPAPQGEISALITPTQAAIVSPPAPSATSAAAKPSGELTTAQIRKIRDIEALQGPEAALKELSDLRYSNSQPRKPIVVGNKLVDPVTFQPLFDASSAEVVNSTPLKDANGNVYGYKNEYPSGEIKVESVPPNPTTQMDDKTRELLQRNFLDKELPVARTSLNAIRNGIEAKQALSEGAYVGPSGAVSEKFARTLSLLGITDTQLTATGKFRSAAGAQAVDMMAMFGGNDTDQEFVRAKEIVGANTELTREQLNEIIDLQMRLAARKYNERVNIASGLGIPKQFLGLPELKNEFGDVFDENGMYVGSQAPQTTAPPQTGGLQGLSDAELDRLIAEEQAKLQPPSTSSLVPTGN